jgi:hypothetical protein
MKNGLALALAAFACAFLVSAPASSAPLGAAGKAVGVAQAEEGLVQQVHRRWRRHHRHFYRGPRFYSPYYSYYGPRYYSPYYYGGNYPYHYRRRPGFSIYLNF